MSANRSWDIQPNRPAAKPVVTQPVTRERVRTRSVPTRRESVRRVPREAPRTPLKRRRREARKRLLILGSIGLFILAILLLVLLWQPWFRVSTVAAQGPENERLQVFVQKELSGTRFFIVPKNSIFFIPEKDVRAHVLAAFPELEAVSIHPAGLSTLAVTSVGRSSVIWWCGPSPDAALPSCYQTDAQGFIFAEVPVEERAATTTTLSIYAPLTQELVGSTTAAGATIAHASLLPNLIQFVKTMRNLNADVISVAVRGDEADLYTRGGTRITYVLGREKTAAALAASSFSTLNLNDGSLLYVDLRFDSKIFFKKK